MIITMQDLSEQIIQQFAFKHQPNKLIIKAHTEHTIYKGELISGQTKRTLEEYQQFLTQNEYQLLYHDFQRLRFVSYGHHFILQNQDILTLKQLVQKKNQTESEIEQLKNQTRKKTNELNSIESKINNLTKALQKKAPQLKFQERIDKREIICKLEELKELGSYVLGDFPNLQKFDFRNSRITDEGLKTLAENGDKLKSLKWIYLNNNNIRDEGLRTLAENGHNFKGLEWIDLCNNNIRDSGLRALAENGDKFKSLQRIYLGSNKITDEGLRALAENENKFMSLEAIDLNDNKITDEGLRALVENGDRFKSLRWINFEKNSITQSCVKQIRSRIKIKFTIKI